VQLHYIYKSSILTCSTALLLSVNSLICFGLTYRPSSGIQHTI